MRGTVLIGFLLAGLAAPAAAQEPAPAGAPNGGDMRELVEAMKATAKATRESADYDRVVPDLLTQILAKLDKIEDKLDKIESSRKGGRR